MKTMGCLLKMQVEQVLSKVTFAPSCVDMGWQWEIKTVTDQPDVNDPASCEVLGWHVRCSFQRPDRDTGVIARGFGRWWFVPLGESESGIVKTAYSAARMIVEHELMEAFRYEGVRIFDPHHTVEQLGRAAGSPQ